ncbi:MAG: spore coat protein [Veillonellaceae bacterium]|jgi:spore coat protein CotF|nr:spore coat protein [Veillonellaceae bacterium]
MAQQKQQTQDMELIGTLIYQLKMESSSICTAILESANDNVRMQLTQILNKSLQNQKSVFDLMSQKGWYKTEAAPAEQYQRIQQSFVTMQQQQQQAQSQMQ